MSLFKTENLTSLDHPIFIESIRFIQSELGFTGLNLLEQRVLERMIHSAGDFEIQSLLRFSSGACQAGVSALQAGAPILTDTAMAAAAVMPMARRTLNSDVMTVLDWVPKEPLSGSTRTALGMKLAWTEISYKCFDECSPIVLIGSAPKALDTLLDLIKLGAPTPSLIIGMPVGFIGVQESKQRLSNSNLNQIRLDGSRGGAGLAAAAINALLRASIDVK